MKHNPYSGKFITFDGPNGSGKTTLIEEIKIQLRKAGIFASYTKEPTETESGLFARKFAEECTGISLACIVAADRYNHLEKVIIPSLKEGIPVISDRYVLSSYILQAMDGVDNSFITAINEKIILPDLQIIVTAEAKTLKKRLFEREELTRFEKDNQSQKELETMREGIEILKKLNVRCIVVDNDNDLESNVKTVTEEIIKLLT